MVSAELQKIFAKVDKGACLRNTFVAHGQPCSWGNCKRYFKQHLEAREAAAVLVAASRASAPASSGAGGSAPAARGSAKGKAPLDGRRRGGRHAREEAQEL